MNFAEKSEVDKLDLENKKNKMLSELQEADSIKNKVIRDFSEIIIIGIDTRNYISLILKMQNLLNYALKFVENLEYIDFKILNMVFKQKYHKILDNIIQMALLMKETMKWVQNNPSGVIPDINKMHQVSENTEQLIRTIMSLIFIDNDLKVRDLVLIFSSIKIIESILDKINHIADNIRILYYESQFWSKENK
ncbi:MAG: DUF47 family protein [Promethearchaeota archaeon]